MSERGVLLRNLSAQFLALILCACSGGGGEQPPPKVRIPNPSVSATSDAANTQVVVASVTVVFENLREGPFYILAQTESPAVVDFDLVFQIDQVADLVLTFAPGASLGEGTYTGDVEFQFCLDERCRRPFEGSPVRVQTTYVVGPSRGHGSGDPASPPPPDPEPAPPPRPKLELREIHRFSHDVIDAAYSEFADALVTIGSVGGNRLHAYRLGAGDEVSVDLPGAPTRLSVSPDGRTVAVAQGRVVTLFDLDDLLAGGNGSPRSYDAGIEPFDLAVADDGRVFMTEAGSRFTPIRQIDPATGTVAEAAGPDVYGGTVLKVHPDGRRLYYAINGLLPQDVGRADIDGAVPQVMGDSRYHGDYPLCGPLWFDRDGDRLFSSCGATLTLDADYGNDAELRYDGTVELEREENGGFRIRSASFGAPSDELLLVQQARCGDPSDPLCTSVVSMHDGEHLVLRQRFDLPDRTVNGQEYRQIAEYVFHAGTRRLLLSRLQDMPNAEFAWYLDEILSVADRPLARAPIDPGPYPVPQDEQQFPAMPVVERWALPMRPVDVAYSDALDRIVGVASVPTNQIFLIDPADGSVVAAELPRPPTSLSLSPDGLTAAVGLDARVSFHDLTSLASGDGGAPKLARVPIRVGDVVLDDVGRVHAFSERYVSDGGPFTVDSATGIATQTSDREADVVQRAVFAARQRAVYSARSQSLTRWDVSGPALSRMRSRRTESRCGTLWLQEDGERLFGSCGNAYRVSDAESQDMQRIGRLEFPSFNSYEGGAASISHSEERGELAVVEEDRIFCTFGGNTQCRTRLLLFEDEFLSATEAYGIGAVTVDGKAYAQRGEFVLHDASGERLFVISRLIGDVDPARKYYLTQVR